MRSDARASVSPIDGHGDGRRTGTVIRRIEASGFCFVKDDQDGAEYFVHLSNCLVGSWDRMHPGAVVSFIPTTTAKGRRGLEAKVVTK